MAMSLYSGGRHGMAGAGGSTRGIKVVVTMFSEDMSAFEDGSVRAGAWPTVDNMLISC